MSNRRLAAGAAASVVGLVLAALRWIVSQDTLDRWREKGDGKRPR